jgi:hypothetical protein
MSVGIRRTCLVLLLAPFLAVTSAQGSDLLETLRREAPEAWEKYTQRCRKLQGRIRSARLDTTQAPAKLLNESLIEFRQAGNCAWVKVERKDWETGGTIISLYAMNDAYAFQLHRTGAVKDWALSHLVRLPGGDPLSRLGARYYIESWMESAYKMRSLGMPFPVVDKRVIIEGADYVREAHDRAVLIRFVWYGSTDPEQDVRKGWVILNNRWLIEEGEITRSASSPEEPFVGRIKCVYTSLPDGAPVLSSVETWTRFPLKETSYYITTTSELWEKPEPSLEEFRLSHYGLTELPEIVWPKPTPWWLYISLSGLVMVLLGLAYYAWRRHRRAASA